MKRRQALPHPVVRVPRRRPGIPRGPAAGPLEPDPRVLAPRQQERRGVLLADRGEQVAVRAHLVKDRVRILLVLRAADMAQDRPALLRLHLDAVKRLAAAEEVPREAVLGKCCHDSCTWSTYDFFFFKS